MIIPNVFYILSTNTVSVNEEIGRLLQIYFGEKHPNGF